MDDQLENAILSHLRIVAHAKSALLQVAVNISDDYPTDASTLIAVISSLTRSADDLLGETTP